MSLLDPLNNYCERLSAGLWAEPLNAASNLAFFIAAYLLYRLYRTEGRREAPTALLIALIAIVGIGSTLFHTFANRLTLLADVIPITLFVLCYLYIALRRLLNLSKLKAGLWLGLFLVFAYAMAFVPGQWRFNGSIDYLPCLGALLAMAYATRAQPAGKQLLQAASIFALSLTLRSLDKALCPLLPMGTHMLWHMLNGVLLYRLVVITQKPLRNG